MFNFIMKIIQTFDPNTLETDCNCDCESTFGRVVLTITLYHCVRNFLMHFHNVLHMLQQIVQHIWVYSNNLLIRNNYYKIYF